MAEQIMVEPPAPALRLAGPPPAAISASPVAQGMGRGPLAYAELHCLSHFSFLRGASSPAELVHRAKSLGYAALALTDECSVAGAVRAFEAARDCGLHLIHGSEFAWGPLRVVVLVRDLQGWGNLCEFITVARSRAAKGDYLVDESSPWQLLNQGCECLLLPQRGKLDASDLIAVIDCLKSVSAYLDAENLWLGVELHLAPDDSLWLQTLQQAGAALGLRLLACGDVHMHARSRKPLQDVVTAIRMGRTVAECGFALQPNAERHLRSRLRLASLYPRAMLEATLELAGRCSFTLDEIRYHYPQESVLPGMTATQTLAWLTWEGAAGRYPQGIPEKVHDQLHKELALIEDKKYEMYFLTVHDIVRYARSVGILCQGRGSAANSAVCYCLGITAVNPHGGNLLFERFISKERGEPPDIDVDFEHARREEVIQYIYGKYGRDRAALTAVVSCWRSRSALRDVGKALGLPADLIDALAKGQYWFSEHAQAQAQTHAETADAAEEDHVPEALPEDWVQRKLQEAEVLAREMNCAVGAHRLRLWIELAWQLKDSPRHLSQHVGGFVLTEGKLTRLVPVEPATMARRSVIQWDKDDLDVVNLLKVDVLALGMLTMLRNALNERARWRGEPWELYQIPQEDAATYEMICQADTVGTFQIESRAQMSMLPRLQPRTFYDLVVEVAIVRPGPIQGGMVHPYLLARERERRGLALKLPDPELENALLRTLGVPIFQEQVMQIAMDAAKFSAGKADELRRSMAAWKRKGGVHKFERPLIDGMVARGYKLEFAQAIFAQMLGFGEYGFPESHAYSFALLAYASAWLKRHEPAIFLQALLNAQPMGFYSPSQLVQDARRHGVRVLPVDVCHSHWHCTLDAPVQAIRGVAQPQPAVRLGLNRVARLGKAAALRIEGEAAQAPWKDVSDLAIRARLDKADMEALAAADALRSLAGHRRQQMWDAAAQVSLPPIFAQAAIHEPRLELPQAAEGEEIMFDYAATGLSLRRHPLALLRPRLARHGLKTAVELRQMLPGQKVRACGIVTVRQRPPTANGTLFITLEDETGVINLVVWSQTFARWRSALLASRLLAVEGIWQRSTAPQLEASESAGNMPEAQNGDGPAVRHLVVMKARNVTRWLGRFAEVGLNSRDFH
ncbi:DNA polymerase [Comamonas testosteroni TK102]|uniref:Error-prone DNA polymerase n=1 Tax=Comamonas testosteroni TK102 TaxID=1392005 RepID=A0A076PJ43_COMTE|nr:MULTISPECIES: error-prone DNA polymerase [Comamonas]AIJ46799.1 DNA polymerase [Comamonas testosteroni TK102]MPS89626.1 DNA polymerase III subunit alpha [Comamonas sp.]